MKRYAVFVTRCAVSGVLTAMLTALTGEFSAMARAQTYPVKVVRYIVPGSPGSGADILGRIVASGMSQVLGQQVIVENRAGGGGNIGVEVAAKSQPDGYTILQITKNHAINVSLYPNLSYDLLRDFSPLIQLCASTSVVVVHPSLPAKSLPDLVRLAKSRPGAINYASAGVGTPTFISAEMFKGMAGVNILHVPYRGGGESLTSILSGETSVYFASTGVALPFIREGRLRALAVTSARRLPSLAQYPTVAESGFPGYQSVGWYGLMLPAKTPREIGAAVYAASAAALKDTNVIARLHDQGCLAIGDKPEEFAAHIRSEIAAMAVIVRQFKLTPD